VWRLRRFHPRFRGKFSLSITIHAIVRVTSRWTSHAAIPNAFRYLFESEQGKSHALNLGIREARGDVIAFMDDDVIVDPAWLRNLTVPIESDHWAGAGRSGHPTVEYGTVQSGFLKTEKSLRHSFPLIVGTKPEPSARPHLERTWHFGRRCSRDTETFERISGHGPVPRFGAKTQSFGRRVLNGGERLYYEPAAVVHHPVASERLTRSYFLKWWFDKGRSDTLECPQHDSYSCGGGFPCLCLSGSPEILSGGL
jgi:glycosyltransferase involved in cell wall biosynthesis